MAARPSVAFVLVGALASLGASYRTQNFLVEAPTPQIAQQIGEYAERYRKEKAVLWLGQEMPNWQQPCPLRVTVTMNGAGGATSFGFDRGRILSMDMHIEGPLDRLLQSVLPHEVTHTVFAHYYRTPVPRWADEGGSVLSEDELERNRHDQLVRQILNTPGRAIPLRRLFSLTEYPRDVMVLYAEGYSVTNYLVGLSSRPQFLAFIAQGMRGDWDGAVRAHYRFNNVEELEQAWLNNLRKTKQQREEVLASGRGPTEGQIVVRQTAPPLPDTPRPVYRGQAPEEPAPYGYLPEYSRPAPAMPVSQPNVPPPPPVWPGPAAPPPGQVSLGAPQFENVQRQSPAPAQVQLGQPVFFAPPVPAGPSR
jgi:hypothetical protein